MKLFEQILKKNKKEKLIEEKDRLVIGFSGGPDSVFLVEALLELKKHLNFEMVLVHINHLLRGEDAQKDEDFSIEYGKSKNLEVFSKKIDIISFGKEKGLTLEEAGREGRYNFYKEIMELKKCNKIVLAHNKDDQIETFMFRLTRGTSLNGLEGINSKRDVYIRPISEIYKKDIIKYLNENNIPYRIDKTNFENEFTRNSIRLDLIPFIEQRYNPKFKDRLYSLIEEIREINSFINEEVEKYSNVDILDIEILKNLPSQVKRGILSRYLYRFGIEVSRSKLILIENLFYKGGSQNIDLSREYILKKEYNFLKIEKKDIKMSKIPPQTLKIPGEVIFGKYIIKSELASKVDYNRECFCTNLKVGDEVTIRGRAEGDRIIPVGMKGEKKVKDIFINEKVEKARRDSVPLVVYKDDIVWIGGIRGNEKYKYKNNESCIKFSIRRIK